MNTVDKFALIPFNKYQRLLRTTHTNEPHTFLTNHSIDKALNKQKFQIGAGNGQKEEGDNAALNDINTTVSKELNASKPYPPPGIPSEDADLNKQTFDDKDKWLSYWEEL